MSRAFPALTAGKMGYMQYGAYDEGVFHQRQLLSRVGLTIWLILTPDDDLYTEDLVALDFIPAKVDGDPSALRGYMVYRFDDLVTSRDTEWWVELLEAGRVRAALERCSRNTDRPRSGRGDG